MLELKRLTGEETGVADEFRTDWEAQEIDFYEDVAYGMGGDHPMYLDLMLPQEKAQKNRVSDCFGKECYAFSPFFICILPKSPSGHNTAQGPELQDRPAGIPHRRSPPPPFPAPG